MNKLPEMTFHWDDAPPVHEIIEREWIVTNGLSSFSSSALGLVNTRRYHGFFVPSLPAPFGRAVLIPRLMVTAHLEGQAARLDGDDNERGDLPPSALRTFRLVGLVPEWEWNVLGTRVRQRVVMVYGHNTLVSTWEHVSGPPLELRLRPFTAFRLLDRPLLAEALVPSVTVTGERVEIVAAPDTPSAKLRMRGATFTVDPMTSEPLYYRVERGRGLDSVERQKSPGFWTAQLPVGGTVMLELTSEGWDQIEGVDLTEAFTHEWNRERILLDIAPPGDETVQRLQLAADQFIIRPTSSGKGDRSVVAGYPWFTDWGRDTMISLEGLTLCTGRFNEAAAILRTFSSYVRDGLLPNLFPEGGRDGLYHTADATMWFFHAIARYTKATGDRSVIADLLPTLETIIQKHVEGTRFGIGVDPADGLLRQGELGYQLTWMDAKVGDWVVTPRRGKAVEINALWYNALCYMGEWVPGSDYAERAGRVKKSFNDRFWNAATDCLWDVLDPDDAAIRPNQVFAISLDHPVLEPHLWGKVLAVVERDLVTPFGLRSLSPGHPDYKATYDGDLRARDAAYHQGTVWAWLIGHFIDAANKTAAPRPWLGGLDAHLREAGVGQVSEIFDATDPYVPRGCFAQAWSTAELLRMHLVKK